jgi:deoxyribodipyrimidine photo-lyase
VTSIRVRVVVDRPPVADAQYVLYWMRATRRADNNFALDRAIAWAKQLGKPLVVLEALRCDYPWAADRHHAFVIGGMHDNAKAFAPATVLYHPYVEPAKGHGRGLIRALGEHACLVVTDDHPSFHFPHMLDAAAKQLDVRLEAVDSIGLLPIAATDKAFPTAYAFRRFLQRALPEHLGTLPSPTPLRSLALPRLERLPQSITDRWPATIAADLESPAALLARLPIDHEVGAVASVPGGSKAAAARVKALLDTRLPAYAEGRNHPDDDAGSGLSPYLHFGHVSSHAILRAIGKAHDWTPASLPDGGNGAKEGWWGLPPAVEAFLDELVTWREVGHNFAAMRDDLEDYASLPTWAKQTLANHASDPRESLYDRTAFESAATHDEIWNAAQRQLCRDGTIHNYLRMLWGKKVLHWSRTPEEAAALLVELNNRWAIDGRDPNSYSGIYWVFGRYDRPWGPERPIFGTVRYMSSDATRRKLRLKRYLARYG